MTLLRNTRKAEARRCTEATRDLLLAYKALLEEELRPSGVTLALLRMLKAIEAQQNVSAATIARVCHVTPQTLQSILARATREGWVTRGSSEANGRFLTASLTAGGRDILRLGTEIAERIEEQAWSGVPVEAMRSMRRTLELAVAKLQRE